MMKEFSKFLLRINDCKLVRKGNTIDVMIRNKSVGSFIISGNKRIRLKHCGSEMSEKIQEIVRFRFAIRKEHPIKLGDNQCLQYNCFQKILDEYPQEWEVFTKGHSMMDIKLTQSANIECMLKVLQHFEDRLKDTLGG